MAGALLRVAMLSTLAFAATIAQAYDIVSGEIRTALVIGNAAYRNAPLRNPVNDAQAVAAALRGLGFEVILRENASQRETLDAFREFAFKSAKSQVRLLYYAGHGVQNFSPSPLPITGEAAAQQRVRGASAASCP